jgi:hypothetical protein
MQQEGCLLSRTVRLTSAEALRSAIEYMMSYETGNFTIASESSSSVTFRNYRSPPQGITILLLLPAVLYLLVTTLFVGGFGGLVFLLLLLPITVYLVGYGRHIYSSVMAVPFEGGSLVRISGESELGYTLLHRWLETLPPMNDASETER